MCNARTAQPATCKVFGIKKLHIFVQFFCRNSQDLAGGGPCITFVHETGKGV